MDAHVRLDLVSPPAPRLVDLPLRVPPGTLHPTLATSAFNYLLRFELERRHPHARRRAWLAEGAPERLGKLAPELVAPADGMLAVARRDLAAFLAETGSGATPREAMATHALRLGRLDAVVRTGYVDRALEGAEKAEDVAELLAMLDAAPWDELGGARSVDLGPSFPRFADVSPETRADLAVDGLLLLVKTTKMARVEPEDLRGLVFRLILALAEPPQGEGFRDVREIGVYFARHGHVWRVPVGPILQHEGFPKVESWFVYRLDRTQRGLAKARQGAREGDPEPVRPGLAKTPKWVKKRASPGKGAPARSQGKAEVKKAKAPKDHPAKPPLADDRATTSKPKAPAHSSSGDAPPRPKSPKPDWRRGSAWRKERGL